MIPQFPHFKKLEISDKNYIEEITKKYPPYSDYNFTSMWSWNINDSMLLSNLNGNLVVRFTDYISGEPFYSFLGTTNVNDTVEKLLQLSKEQNLKPVLKLVGEEAIKELDKEKFQYKEDREHFDYIYDVHSLAELEDSRFYIKRKHSRYFKKNFPHEVLKHITLTQDTKRQILDLFSDWAENKQSTNNEGYSHQEFIALSRFLNYCDNHDFFIIGIYKENKLIGASIAEHVGNNYNISHFQKSAHFIYKGINTYLNHEFARHAREDGIIHLNWEQDLDIPGLRENKESYLPSHFLKKFSISTV